MKNIIILIVSMSFLLQLSIFGQSVYLPDFNEDLEDISLKGVKKEQLFTSLDRDLIKLSNSVCANRALMWLYQMNRQENVTGGKIFLFYTGKTGDAGEKTWWYHVAPLVNEQSKLYVLDAGFTYSIKKPLLVNDWLKTFVGTNNCKEISKNDKSLLRRMFNRRVFPETYEGKSYDCYYIKAPAFYWVPSSVAMKLLEEDYKGDYINFDRRSFNKAEVKSACIEAVTTSVGRVLGFGKEKCKKFLEL